MLLFSEGSLLNEELTYVLPYTQVQDFINCLISAHYRCIGPQVRDGAIVYDELTQCGQLPWGLREIQKPGEYQLEKIAEHKAFSWANGPQALKPLLFKPQESLWRVVRDEQGALTFESVQPKEKPIAFIGARACDIEAMLIQDKVFLSKPHADPRYQHRRENLLIIAVNCSYASDNCFCVSAGTGPEVTRAYDILLTEIDHGFIVKVGSDQGRRIIDTLYLNQASPSQCQIAKQDTQQAADMQTKRIPLDNQRGLRDVLFNQLDHPRWQEVADRCLSCGNCTQVCPTCFCHSEEEHPDLDGESSEHQRVWDSCFSQGHSFVSGHPLRDETHKRYRQWLTHKVGSWFDQFDVSGCVGCGRCVTWCPVGIDITEELAVLSGETNKRKDKL